MTRHDSTMTDPISRRSLLVAVATGSMLGLGGCLTVDPSVRVSGLADSNVFKQVKTSESWASGRVALSVSLTSVATTTHGVRQLAVIDRSGEKFDTVTVYSGQTSKTVFAPTHQPATLSATDYDGKTVDQVRVTVSGQKIV